MRITVLDPVRFFAALAVVFYHYTARHENGYFDTLSNVTQYGYLGVPLFFMISGFVISASAKNRSASAFAVSRVVRLYPALWVCVSITAVFVVSFESGPVAVSFGQYISNLTLLYEYIGYPPVDGVYWTLVAELKFYACVFLLLLLNVFKYYRIWLSAWMLMTVMHLLFNEPFFMGWFISPYYSSYFIAGVVFYLVLQDGFDRFKVSLLLLSLAVSSIKGFEQAGGFMVNPSDVERYIAVFIMWSFYVLFALTAMGKLELKNSRILMYMGGMTYPVYLLHNRVGKLIIDSSAGYVNEAVAVFLTIVFILLLSLVIHVYLEGKVATPLKMVLLKMVNRPS